MQAEAAGLSRMRRTRARSASSASPPGASLFQAAHTPAGSRKSAEYEDIGTDYCAEEFVRALYDTADTMLIASEARARIKSPRSSDADLLRSYSAPVSPRKGSLRRALSTGNKHKTRQRSKLATEALSSESESAHGSSVSFSSSASASDEKRVRRLSLSGRLRMPRLQPISEEVPASLVVYFKDFLGRAPPIILVIPNSNITESMRRCFDMAAACDWDIEAEDSSLNHTLKQEVLYMIDPDFHPRPGKGGRRGLRNELMIDHCGERIRQGQLARLYRQPHGTSQATGYVITNYYVFRTTL